MATSSNPRTPLRESKTKRNTDLDIFGLGSDDDLPPTDPRHANMTIERLFSEGYIVTGGFSYNHPQFEREMAKFNGVKVNGKPTWQKQPSGPSTLHNNIVVTDHFRSLAPFLGPLAKLCKPRPSTDRLFTKQRVQQSIKSGRRHHDAKNAPWRVCVTVANLSAPKGLKQLEIGMTDASKAKGGGAVNPWQLQADGEPDARRFDCVTGSYHVMDTVATGLDSHAHHQALVNKELILKHGALTTFVLDLDPVNLDTFIDDVAEIARGTADAVIDGVGESAYVPPPTAAQMGTSSYSQKWRDWNQQQKYTNLENYLQQRRDTGE
ncbi:unnamed protein product [Ectocarpus sp. CCAP 1310/34]|nr:unnamed protein product [Ectocarpus sp. CCAP 1310/34]